MSRCHHRRLEDILPLCRACLDDSAWDAVVAAAGESMSPDALAEAFRQIRGNGAPLYLPDLARLELALDAVRKNADTLPGSVARITLNPTIVLLELSWSGLAAFREKPLSPRAVPAKERVILWVDPPTKAVNVRSATDEDLLMLKMTAEDIPAETVARTGNLPIGAVDAAMDRAVRNGLLLAPPSQLRREPSILPAGRSEDRLVVSPSFTLQWHITQVCDLHCKHCYDRADRIPLAYEEAIGVLDDLRAFCRERGVQGSVSFTGGNPLLHPRFLDIYRAAADRNFAVAILGNPAPRERIEEIIGVSMPAFYQVSLEGLREQNDGIRGKGHFDRVMAFLDLLRSLKVPSMVMLTLTRQNRDQVIPLAEHLRGRADVFHFNRLALFGEGANLAAVPAAGYRAFLEDYLKAAASNPVMGYKDSLINILLKERERDLFGGCSGHGCGAAFDFVALLSDGEVHACRKLPSKIGNIRELSLARIYDSDLARRYRRGPASCSGCDIRAACGGCLASVKSSGLDIFRDRDPFCFLSRS